MVSYQSLWQALKYLTNVVVIPITLAACSSGQTPAIIEIQGNIKPEISVPLDRRGNPLFDTNTSNGMVRVVNPNGEAREYLVTYAPPINGQGIEALARRFNCGADRAQLRGLVLLMANLINSSEEELGNGARIAYHLVAEAPNLTAPTKSAIVLYPVVQDPSLQCKR